MAGDESDRFVNTGEVKKYIFLSIKLVRRHKIINLIYKVFGDC